MKLHILATILATVILIFAATTAAAETDAERVLRLQAAIDEHMDRIIVLESRKNGQNDANIDEQIARIQIQIDNKQAIIDWMIGGVAPEPATPTVAALQEQMNYIISELNRLIGLILQVQVELAALILTEPEPITVPEHTPVNTLEPYVMTDKAAYGLGDTIHVTAIPQNPDAPTTLNGTKQEVTRVLYVIDLRKSFWDDAGFKRLGSCYLEWSINDPDNNGTTSSPPASSLEGHWDDNNNGPPGCMLNSDGTVTWSYTITGDDYAGEYQAYAKHNRSWESASQFEGRYIISQPFIVQ